MQDLLSLLMRYMVSTKGKISSLLSGVHGTVLVLARLRDHEDMDEGMMTNQDRPTDPWLPTHL